MNENKKVKKLILSEIEKRRNEWINLLSKVVQFKTDNPPSDTRELVAFLSSYLKEKGLPSIQFMPMEPFSNLITYIGKEGLTPHLTLNGHLDQFPVDDPKFWKYPPYSGLIKDGKIYGRGVSDMKGGTIASFVALVLLHDLKIKLKGRLSFMGVSEEETGGQYGTQSIIKNYPEFVGEACLIGEPYAPDVIGIGEKGAYRMILRSEGEPMHGSLGSGDNAIIKMAKAILALQPILKEKADIPLELVEIIEREKEYTRSPQDVGRQWLLEYPSYNVGVIRGGTKINLVPRYCEAELDIRLPVGFKKERMRKLITELLKKNDCEDITVFPSLLNDVSEDLSPPDIRREEANWTSPDEKIVQIVKQNVKDVIQKDPIYFIGLGATDGRFFRNKGIPTVIYGPRPFNMGGNDEYILVEDFITVIKVHIFSILDYLGFSL